MTRAELMALQRTLPYLPSGRARGCVRARQLLLPVCSAGGEKTAATLYFLDSNTLRRDPDRGIRAAATAPDRVVLADGGKRWPRPRRRAAARARLFSYPLSEYNEGGPARLLSGTSSSRYAPLINTGFYAALHEAGDVMGTSSGMTM